MKPEDKALLKTTIERALAHLRDEVQALEEQTEPVAPDRAIGRLTRMDAIQSKNIAAAQLRKAQSRAAQLEKALHALASDSFGICTRCGRAIPVKRLLLVPESTTHVRCPRRRE
ncbi:DksA C4-type domain-containing protein [Acanthopleuribacter pedis]